MFVGHYAAAFAAKAARPALPLWLLFVAVQLVDFIWAGLIIAGIEKVRIVPGFTAASPLDLYHMPFTHSLAAGIVWSLAFGALYLLWKRGAGRGASAVVLGLAVFSHWLTDLLVHVPDLPLIYGEPKLGFGLWRYFWVSQLLEVGLVVGALVWYMRATAPTGSWGRVAPYLLVGFMLAVQAYSHLPADPLPVTAFAVQALIVYSLYAGLALLVERTRVAKDSDGLASA